MPQKYTREGHIDDVQDASYYQCYGIEWKHGRWIKGIGGNMKFLRAKKGRIRRDSVRNTEIRMNVNVECKRDRVEKTRIRWSGLVKRIEKESLPRRMVGVMVKRTSLRGCLD